MTDTADLAEASDFDLPQVYKHHVFACYTQRPPGHPAEAAGRWGRSRYGIGSARRSSRKD